MRNGINKQSDVLGASLMFGCLNTIVKTITQSIVAMVTFVVFVCVVCAACVGIIALAQQQQTNQVINELNDGFGSEDKPVASNTFMRFENGHVRATYVDRNSTQRIMNYSVLNDGPAVGSAWVLVNIEVLCLQQACREWQLEFTLLDDRGRTFKEAPFMLYSDKLDDGVEGATFAGFQIFEVPTDAVLTMLRVKWGGVTLHGRLP